MYQWDDPFILPWQHSALKGENDSLKLALDTFVTELKRIQDEKIALEMKVQTLEGEIEIGLQTVDIFKNDADKDNVFLLHSSVIRNKIYSGLTGMIHVTEIF